jgi:hypothetical protein
MPGTKGGAMTRTERAAEREQRLKDVLLKKSRELAQVQAQQREEARKQQSKRRFEVGKLADDAGLCAWEDATLIGLFAVLARLRETPEPVKVLETLVDEVGNASAYGGKYVHAS